MKTTTPDPNKVFGQGDAPYVRVKNPGERYCEKRYEARHRKTGEVVVDPIYQRPCATMSEGAKARHGVLFKHLARKAGILREPATEHESALLTEMVEKGAWCGRIGPESENASYFDYIGGHRNIKALIDDATSGGLEITPIEFDSDVITFPLLTGELFPNVDLRPVPRGRRIEGASITTPTMQWGGQDDAAMDLFNTNDMVAAIDTTIFAVDGSILIGKDFLSDSPVEVGNVLTALVGERLAQTLDAVVANGNGTTQPTGIFQAAGVSTVNTDNSASGPPSLADYIELLFSLGKQYRTPSNRVCFVSNDTSYQRSRSIRVDPQSSTTDQRPVLTGGDTTSFQNYMTLGLPHKVENNNIANTQAAVIAFMKYRMYRRLGLEINFDDRGATLRRANEVLMTYRARFGGKLMDASAMAKWTDGQS
ncbi:MAG: phage major capsid protein [Pirellulaceae bacterium]